MTDLRQAAQQALEALEAVHTDFVCRATHHKKKDQHGGLDICPNATRHITAITALQAALEQSDAGIPVSGEWVGCGECDSVFRCHVGKAKCIRLPVEQQAEPSQWRDMIVVNLVREGINKHRARELADHFATQPTQQAEPVAMRMPKVGDRVICLEDESLGTVVSLTAGGSPDITFDDGSRGTYLLREFAELFSYAAAAQRPWVGLEPEEILDLFDRNNVYGSKWIEFARTVEAKLKERNSENSNQ